MCKISIQTRQKTVLRSRKPQALTGPPLLLAQDMLVKDMQGCPSQHEFWRRFQGLAFVHNTENYFFWLKKGKRNTEKRSEEESHGDESSWELFFPFNWCRDLTINAFSNVFWIQAEKKNAVFSFFRDQDYVVQIFFLTCQVNLCEIPETCSIKSTTLSINFIHVRIRPTSES